MSIVATPYGPVRGTDRDGIHVFRGIPFGASTEGEGRFAPPRPPEAWDDPLACAAPGPAAPQNPSILETSLGVAGLTYGEDCLRANVFSPDLDGSAPVMVWLHGGGFETGTASMSWYDGGSLARRGVVVVTLGYRLGALGFLHLPGVEGSGCFGILDQIAGLEWVRDSVAAFGGDPDQVTVFGESAGAMSTATVMTAPGAKGLFQKAILQSGAGQNVHEPDAAARVTARFTAAAGVDSTDLGALRALPLDALLAAQATVGREGDAGEAFLPWQPVIGSEAAPVEPLAAMRDGAADGIDVVVGTTYEEMKLFPLLSPWLADVDDAGLAERLATFEQATGREPGSLVEAYDRIADLPAPERWLALLTDVVFRIPAIRMVETLVGRGASARMYLFAEPSDILGGALGSCHALDLPYSWDNLDASGTEALVGEITSARRSLARTMGDLWAGFARGDALDNWPTYDEHRRATLWLQADRAEVVDDPMAGERIWWDGLDAGMGATPRFEQG